ncbi:MAG: hypothetical protein PF570_02180 [Candidatus Cloacimonetes bacterium]|jgi:hypothetical protein|nr:hypothetical protein [Candidatus Cloacimonadota bacterium]
MKNVLIRFGLVCIFLLSGTILLIAKDTTIKLSKITQFRKEMKLREVEYILKNDPEFIIDSDSLTIKNNLEMRIYKVSPELYHTRYFILFNNEKLEFWGYPHEYARHKNKLYNEFIQIAIDIVADKDEKIAKAKEAEYQKKLDERNKREEEIRNRPH